MITIYFVYSLIYPFANTRHRGLRLRPYLQLIHQSTYLPVCLPIYLPTNQPIYLPTYMVDAAYARVELDARQQRTPSFIEPVLKKPLRLPLNPYPQPAAIVVSDVVYVCLVAVLFFCFEFFSSSLLLFLSDSAAKTEGFISVRFSGGE